MKNTKNKINTYFLCDFCGEKKTGKKHKIYDENWNLQQGCYECDDCFCSRLDSQN